MGVTLWLLSLLATTLIATSECFYAPPPLVKYQHFDDVAVGAQVSKQLESLILFSYLEWIIYDATIHPRCTSLFHASHDLEQKRGTKCLQLYDQDSVHGNTQHGNGNRAEMHLLHDIWWYHPHNNAIMTSTHAYTVSPKKKM